MKFEPIYQLPNAWTLAAGHFGIHLFEGEVTIEEMAEMGRLAEDWRAKNEVRTVELVVVYPSAHRMTAGERKAMTGLMKRWEHLRDASSTVILAEGITGAIQRSILTGLMLVVPPKHPVKICAGVPAAQEFLAPFLEALDGRLAVDALPGAAA